LKSIGREFMKATNTPKLDESDQIKGIPHPSFESSPKDVLAIIDLPNPMSLTVKSIDLRYSIENRRSVRQYSTNPITIGELSYLLWCTQGVKRITPGAAYRNVPSAGTRHALETYLLVNNVDGLRSGLYKYVAMEHKLAEVPCDSNINQSISNACPLGHFIESSAVTFIWTAVFYRMLWRHGERGYRYVHLDAGHVCQNLYLAAQSTECGVCGVSVFVDNTINLLLGADGEEESVIYMATVGKV
jgi:SagB-type dehydrogenase family enzyme